jgi:hypothetical protein
MSFMLHFIYVLLMHFFVGEGVTILTGNEIDDNYLDSNEEEIKKHFKNSRRRRLDMVLLLCVTHGRVRRG